MTKVKLEVNLSQSSNERLLELYYYWRTKYDESDEYRNEVVFNQIEKECLNRMGGNKQ